MAIGPTMPPGMGTSARQEEAADSSDDDYGPALPPDLAAPAPSGAAPSATAARPSASASSSSRVKLGPSRPPTHVQSTTYDDSDDELGPAPLPSTSTSSNPNSTRNQPGEEEEEDDGIAAFKAAERRRMEHDEKAALAAASSAAPKRDEWMLAPPPSGSLSSLSSVDPTKLKSRAFNTAPGANNASKNKRKGGEVDLWTETPEQRQRRLAEEAMGYRAKAEKSLVDASDDEDGDAGLSKEEKRRKRERDESLRKEVDRFNEKTRKESLLDMHSDDRVKKKVKKTQELTGKIGEDDGPPGIWDRERDMGIRGGPMDPSKRKNMIKDAKALGGRFGGGTFL